MNLTVDQKNGAQKMSGAGSRRIDILTHGGAIPGATNKGPFAATVVEYDRLTIPRHQFAENQITFEHITSFPV